MRMRAKTLRRDQKGQLRIIEALIAVLILLSAFTVSTYLSSTYIVTRKIDLDKLGQNVISCLDDTGVILTLLEEGELSHGELSRYLETLLPKEIYYNITLISSFTNQTITTLSNFPPVEESYRADVSSRKRVVTISLPVARTAKTVDVMLIIDRSGSMDETEPGDDYSKVYYAKAAAQTFLDQLDMDPDHAGLASFSTEATLDHGFSDNASTIKAAIDGLNAFGYTNIGDGILRANDEFTANGRNDSVRAMILLSDGVANRPRNTEGDVDEAYARAYAINMSQASQALGVIPYAIGVGANSSSFDEVLLTSIAPDGYFYAPQAGDLEEIYLLIAKDLLFKVSNDIIVIELTLMEGG
jgi:hypothetical protein